MSTPKKADRDLELYDPLGVRRLVAAGSDIPAGWVEDHPGGGAYDLERPATVSDPGEPTAGSKAAGSKPTAGK